MALLDDIGPLAKYWGSAVAAWNDPELAKGGGSKVQFIWATITQDYLSRGETLPPGSFQRVNRLLNASGAVDRAMKQLGRDTVAAERSGIDRAITSAHIANDISVRDSSIATGQYSYNVRFRADVSIGGMTSTEWFNYHPGVSLPATIFGLQNALDTVAAGFADDYNMETFTPTGDVVITQY